MLWTLLPKKMLIMPIIRHLITGLGGMLTGAGIASSAEAAAIVGGLMAAASVLWGLFEKNSDMNKIANNGH